MRDEIAADKVLAIKIRYVLRNIVTNEIHIKKYYLHQIESAGLGARFDVDSYVLIARNRYTGLKDKNGTEIYEGDILKQDGRMLREVVSGSEYHFTVRILPPDDFGGVFNEVFEEGCEVIADIHSTPELIERKG